MKTLFIGCFLICELVLPSYAAGVMEGADEYAGISCQNMPKGMVLGNFNGVKALPKNPGDHMKEINRRRCFETMLQCRSWLATMEAKYNALPPRTAYCTHYK
ncbi:metallophosphoesterase [Bartonella sp. LJL80]